ncbi:MAG: radical SAM family heme chaperone HemW [Desulfobacterales bacterium]|nr:radical SAM family heme chaperone HemW [Desulfobacterales bacterium]
MEVYDLPGPGQGEEIATIYVHVPFCRSRCPYCSFVSFVVDRDGQVVDYGRALIDQAKAMAENPWVRARQFTSLFFGGGTPARLSVDQLAALCDIFLRRYPFSTEVEPEVSLETNPNTVSRQMLAGLRQAGINRLSIGVQSLSDRLLKKLGRTHSAADARRAVRLARQAGFANLNLDLMYGLPRQSTADWQETLARALELGPEHLAIYELTVEPGTPFAGRLAAGDLHLPDEETLLAMAEVTATLLNQAGFTRYEISNYGRPGYYCRHNINYWENGPYLGIGAGAVSCFSGVRIRNVEDPGEFVRMVAAGRPPFLDAECLDHQSRFRETVIMGLRMLDGISCSRLEERFGLEPRQYYGPLLERLIKEGWLAGSGDRLRLTGPGLGVADSVLSQLV